jgi:phosphoribosylaminoimidazolecarboxamide formyltransferase/IMP cyclohydrolase
MGPMSTLIPIKRALLSVYNKNGIVALAEQLAQLGVEIISTGGTSQALKEAGIKHRTVDDLTGFPAMLDGRVKTLHPHIHAGILNKRDKHAADMRAHRIEDIDLVVVNFYPFTDALKKQALSFSEMIEYIDIGGPTMVRAAAKNCEWVGVIVDPLDYEHVIAELKAERGLTFSTRKKLAEKAFATTSYYDSVIYHYFLKEHAHEKATISVAGLAAAFSLSTLAWDQPIALRYGENPHQAATAYRLQEPTSGVLSAHCYQGKALSFNNMLDFDAALNCVSEFDEPTVVVVKHNNPCGVASRKTIEEAYLAAYDADRLSAFGGVVVLNRPCNEKVALALSQIFLEGLLAPSYTQEALAVLSKKPNLRVLALPVTTHADWEMKCITGGVLLQEKDRHLLTLEDLTCVTQARPHDDEIKDMLFAWHVLKHVKSNGIVIAKDNQTVGVGAGQVSRIDAVNLAIQKGGDRLQGSVLASDAFFPFRDSIDRLSQTPVRAVIQPGGSLKDQEVIDACNEHGIAMVLTGKRCFKH